MESGIDDETDAVVNQVSLSGVEDQDKSVEELRVFGEMLASFLMPRQVRQSPCCYNL